MNLPNRLTLLRMVLVPFLVLFLLCDAIPFSYLWALLVFVAASLTDFFDGKIARDRDLVTNFGKFLDPMADKVLVLSAMICLIPDFCSPVVVIIVAAREFMVSSLRLVAAAQGIVLAAGWSGKAKTASQMVSIVAVLLMCAITQITGMGAAHHAGQPDLNVDYGGAGGVQRIGVSGEKLETGESQAVTKSKKRRHGSLVPCQKLQKKPNIIFW